MLILISGKNGSGKSAFAEKLAARVSRKRFYIATMQPFGHEGAARIEKHRRQRAGQDFETLELPTQISNAPVSLDSVVLLEDVSNLLANALFENAQKDEHVFQDILLLASRCKALVAVTIGEMEPGEYDDETIAYIFTLHRLNALLFERSDIVYEMQNGMAVLRKGAANDLAEITLDRDWNL